MNLNDTLRTNMLGQITTALTTTSRLLVYTGSPPGKTASPTGTLLVVFSLAATPGSASGGVYTFTNPANSTASASGTPGYFRMIDGTTDDGTHTQIQGTASGTGSGSELNFNAAFTSGGAVSITSFTITEGNS